MTSINKIEKEGILMKAKVLVNTSNMEKEEWIEYRKRGIGGSDAAAIAGLDPYKSPINVYLEKTGDYGEKEDNERMRIGRDLEDYVAKRFSRATGEKVRRRNAILQHPKHKWMLGNVDRLIVGKNHGLECKVTNSYKVKEWDTDIPFQYEIQCHHYMAVTGYDAWWIAVLLGNEKFIYKKIERDEDIIKNLIAIEKSFWENNVLEKQIPPPDGSDPSQELIKSMYPKATTNKAIDLNKVEYINKLKRRDEIIELIGKLKREMNEIDQEIQISMKDAERAYIEDRTVTWKNIHITRFNGKKFQKDNPDIYRKYIKTSSYRRFLIK